MMSKALGVALVLAIPGFVGYPAPLSEDVRTNRSPTSPDSALTVDTWSATQASATTAVSLQSRWRIIETQTARRQFLDGEFLTRELQRELRRVGCYAGEINGVWTQSTQRAMKTFTSRVNATLPTDRPDHVLVAMLRSHPDKTCKAPCPTGEIRVP